MSSVLNTLRKSNRLPSDQADVPEQLPEVGERGPVVIPRSGHLLLHLDRVCPPDLTIGALSKLQDLFGLATDGIEGALGSLPGAENRLQAHLPAASFEEFVSGFDVRADVDGVHDLIDGLGPGDPGYVGQLATSDGREKGSSHRHTDSRSKAFSFSNDDTFLTRDSTVSDNSLSWKTVARSSRACSMLSKRLAPLSRI